MFRRMNMLSASPAVLIVSTVVVSLATACNDQAPVAPVQRSQTLARWTMASACKVKDSAAEISSMSFRPERWKPVAVPLTVLAAQLAAGEFNGLSSPDRNAGTFDPYCGTNGCTIPGTTYPVGTFFSNQEMPSDSPYACGWWYRSAFRLNQRHGQRTLLRFAGISYSGVIWGQRSQGCGQGAGCRSLSQI